MKVKVTMNMRLRSGSEGDEDEAQDRAMPITKVLLPMDRLKRQLSCRCRVDSFPRVDSSAVECSRSRLWPTGSSWSFPCAVEVFGLRLAPC